MPWIRNDNAMSTARKKSHKRLKADTSSDKPCIDARWSAPHAAINSHQDLQSKDHGAVRQSVKEILESAAERGSELIAMGARSNANKAAFSRSVSYGVIAQAPRP